MENSISYQGKSGAGQGKHIVFLAGDEEYRSEEGLPMLAKILAERHGFTSTVLFSINPADGAIDPNIPTLTGLNILDKADMCVMLLRFREPADDEMKHFVNFVNSGKPMLGLRTSTHAFNYAKNKTSPYAKYSFNSKDWPGGFGQQVLGDTWVDHHGHHAVESARGILNPELKSHPILKGVGDIWAPSDVYTIKNLPKDAQVLVYGQVLTGMKPDDKPLDGPKNSPMMPVFWTRDYKGETGKTSKVVCTTMGASVDLESEGLRRAVVNSVYWGVGLESKIPEKSDVSYVGAYKPTFFGFNKAAKGVKPAEHK